MFTFLRVCVRGGKEEKNMQLLFFLFSFPPKKSCTQETKKTIPWVFFYFDFFFL